MALHSIFHFSLEEPEVIVVDNAPGSAESAMLDEYPRIRRVDNPTSKTGSDANFEALDIGIQAASNDLLGLLHSDTIFMRPGWDREWFGHVEARNLAALGTFEREANPFRPVRKRVEDVFKHLFHRRKATADRPGKLVLHFVLTRRSALAEVDFNFMRNRDLYSRHLTEVRNGVEVLSLREMSRFLWHTSNITSLLTGQMNDARLVKSYQTKRRRFLNDPFVRKHFAPVLPSDAG